MAVYVVDNLPEPMTMRDGTMLQRTLRNVKNLLMIRKGDVPYDRLRGLDGALLDRPIQELRENLVPELDRVMKWEPDAEVVDADAWVDEQGQTVIRVAVEIGFDQ